MCIKICLESLLKLGGSSQERHALSSVEGPVSTPNIPFLRLSSPPHPILSAHIWLCLQPEGQCRRILISLIMYLESTCDRVVCVWGKHSGKSAFCARCPYKGLVDNAFKAGEGRGRRSTRGQLSLTLASLHQFTLEDSGEETFPIVNNRLTTLLEQRIRLT